jgi:hypothetical protein
VVQQSANASASNAVRYETCNSACIPSDRLIVSAAKAATLNTCVRNYGECSEPFGAGM